jgi:nickel transport protein
MKRYGRNLLNLRNVIPAKPGIRSSDTFLDSCFRGSDVGSGFLAFVFALSFLLFSSPVYAHSIHYEVQQKGISVKVFYSEKDPASYSSYELYGPGDALPHQTGRTDKNGFASFFPDRAGIWKIKIWGESSHGFHGVTIDVRVNEPLHLQSFSRPLVATHTKLIVGISLIFGLFGIYAFLRSRRNRIKENES